MLHLLCIIMVTMSLMIIPSFGTGFRLTPLEGSVKKTKARNIKSFEDVEKLFKASKKKPKYPIFKDLDMLYQAQNVMSMPMYYTGEKGEAGGRPFGMFLDPEESENVEAFRQKISDGSNSKKNPGRVARGYEYKTGRVALYINIPAAISKKDKFGPIEPGWIWMWVPKTKKKGGNINKVLGTKTSLKYAPWIFALRYTEFGASKTKPAAQARIDFADNMDNYDDAYDDLYDDDAYDAYDYAAEYDIYNQRKMALNRLLNAYGLYDY